MYGSDNDFEAWAEARGLTLTGDSTVLRQLGSDYLDATYENALTGSRTDPFVQENAWPRTGATLNCKVAIPSDLVPVPVINAAYRAAWLEDQNAGVLAGPVQSGPRVRRQKVDVLEREFFDDGAVSAGAATGFIDPTIDGAMRQFICDDTDTGGFFFDAIGS